MGRVGWIRVGWGGIGWESGAGWKRWCCMRVRLGYRVEGEWLHGRRATARVRSCSTRAELLHVCVELPCCCTCAELLHPCCCKCAELLHVCVWSCIGAEVLRG